MLDEQKVTAGPEHPGDLAQRARRVQRGAQHEVAHHAVDAGVGHWQLLRRRAHHPRPLAAGRDTALQPAQHPRVRLGEDQLGHLAGVVGQRVAHAGADLQRPAGRLGDHVASGGADATQFHQPDHRRVDRGEPAK